MYCNQNATGFSHSSRVTPRSPGTKEREDEMPLADRIDPRRWRPYARGVRFHVLGPLEARRDDSALALGGPKEQTILAHLLARANEAVSVDSLIEILWGDDAPPTAEKTLQAYVVRLRNALNPERRRGSAGQLIVTRRPGYSLEAAPEEIDARLFENLALDGRQALARGDATGALKALNEALAL